jgi:hypothetical protein
MKVNVMLTLLGLLVLVSACTPSAETQIFMDSLPQLDENLQTDLRNIDTEFENYDLEFGVTRIMNLALIPNSVIISMGRLESDLAKDVASAEEDIASYNKLKTAADASSFDAQTTLLVDEFDSKKSTFNDNKPKVSTCLAKMVEYREFVGLLRANAIISEAFDSQTVQLDEYVSAEQYDDAIGEISKIQKTIYDMKSNAELRADSGIQTFSEEVMASYDALIDSYNIYRQYILEEDEDEYEALFLKYSQSYANTIAMGTDEDGSITVTINEIDDWYQSNIGVCINLFDDV